jgi:hypothetical protein
MNAPITMFFSLFCFIEFRNFHEQHTLAGIAEAFEIADRQI